MRTSRQYLIRVSILVLVDLILWQCKLYGIITPRSKFQSLFWWILYYDCSHDIPYKDWFLVSILVLVDLILWRQNCPSRKGGLRSFNPCFGGSYIMTVDQENIQKRARSFNPCFGGSYIMTSQQINSRFSEISFNPCFGGSYIMTPSLNCVVF